MKIASNTLEKDVAVWKALADNTRRELLDLLRIAPKTTGELVSSFNELGRCAIMKHLGILEQANLISVHREGKFRWNHINAIPLQEIYERWVRKFEGQWASHLLQIKNTAEKSLTKSSNTMELLSNTLKISLSIPINASIDHVWNCLLHDVNSWWRHDFYTSEKTKEFIIEPKVGGRMYEDYGNNEGLLWAEVIVINSPHTLELKGHLTPEFGGPAINFLKISLIEEAGITTLNLTDTVMGDVDEGNKKSLDAGWKLLFGEGLKPYAEK